MPEIMRTEFLLQDENGENLLHYDTLEQAKDAAEEAEALCLIVRVDEYYQDRTIVWASHRSMLEAG